MANHGFGHLDRPTSLEDVKNLLDQCNRERFDGLLRVEAEADALLVYAGEERVFEGRLTSPRLLDVRHGLVSRAAWWAEGYLTSFIVAARGGTISDEGHDEVEAPEFHLQVPTYKEYVRRWVADGKYPRLLGWFKLFMNSRKDYPPALWRVMLKGNVAAPSAGAQTAE